MGVVLACLSISGNSIKKNRDQKKAAQSQSQPLSDSAYAQEGLRDEHLASQPPPSTQVQAAQDTENPGTTGVAEAIRDVGTDAPVPISATIATTSYPTTAAEGKKGDKMATDEDYMAFLDKANQDPSEGTAKTQSSKGKMDFKATDTGISVPKVLQKATQDAFYVSDADEPFVPVCLKFEGKKLPDELSFAKLVNHPDPKQADVQIMDIGEWDPQGQYNELVDATREVSKGSDVRVYRIAHGGARVEYWLVGLEGGKLVGVKALAIES